MRVAGVFISRGKAWSESCNFGQLFLGGALSGPSRAHIFQEKNYSYFSGNELSLDGWGEYFSRKSLVWMAGARISREKGWAGKLGHVFLERKLDWKAGVGLPERIARKDSQKGSPERRARKDSRKG